MNNKKHFKWFDACNIYISLWVLWYVQSFFISSSLLSLIFYVPFFSMSIYYVAKVLTSYKPKGVMLALCVFFVIMLIYGVILLILNDARGQDRKSFLMMLFWSLGPIFSFYVFTKQGLLTEKRIMGWLVIFMIIVPFIFLQSRQNAMKRIMETGKYDAEITNNASYLFAGLFPFVFVLRKKPLFQYLFIGFIFFFIVTGMKRGAMLTAALLLVWFVDVSIESAGRKKWGIVILTIIFMAIGYRYILQYYEQSNYFQNRLEETLEGNTSNRSIIYSKLWNHFIENNNILQLAFGEGAFHTETILGAKAHNDWLELLIDCGLFTVFVYVVYWLCFVRDWRKSKPNHLIYSMMGSCLIYTFTRTFYSMSFSDIPLFTSLIMGYCFANINTGITSYPNTIANV